MTGILGIDLSAHKADLPNVVFDRLDAHGCQFLITRASRGNNYADPTFSRFTRLAQDRGWVTGAFHFMEPPTWVGSDGVNGGTGYEQAEQYLRAVDGLSRLTLDLHVLDVEKAQIKERQIIEFVERLRREGLRVGLYSADWYWRPSGKPRFPVVEAQDPFDFRWWRIGTQTVHINTWDLAEYPTGRLVQFGYIDVPDGTKTSAGKSVKHRMDGNIWHGTLADLRTQVPR